MRILCRPNNYAALAAGILVVTTIGNSAHAAQNGQSGKETETLAPLKETLIIQNNEDSNANKDEVYLLADEIVYSKDGEILEAIGNVEAKSIKRKLFADKIRFNQNTNTITAIGNVTIIEADGSINYANEINVDDKLETGVISDFATRMTDGGLLAAKTATQQKDKKNLLSRTIYTSCNVCKENPIPTWSIKARSAVQDKENQSFTYRDVFFELEGVPVFYIPYFKHGDSSRGSQTGFLPPKPSKSSRLGLGYQQSYLQVIDDYSYLIFSPAIYQNVAPVMGLEYRRNFYSGLLKFSGSVTKEQLFGSGDDKFGEKEWRSHIFGSGEFELNKDWKWGFGLEAASDLRYLYRYSVPGSTLQRGIVKSTGIRLISQIYTQGKSQDFFSRILALKFQELDPSVNSKLTPKVLPQAEIRKSYKLGPWNGVLRTSASLLYLDRRADSQDSGRLSTDLFWHGQKALNNGVIVAPELFVKGAYYLYKNQRDANNILIGNNNFGRFGAGVGLNLSWPLAKFEKNISYLIEPKMNLQLRTKQEGRNYVSPEDAFNYQNDDTSYFEHTTSVNDIWAGGANATIGVNLGMRSASNNAINWFVGKQFKSEADPLLGRTSNLDKKSLDWVSKVDIALTDKLNLSAKVRIDDEGHLGRAEVSGASKLGPFEIEMRYAELSPLLVGNQFSTKELVSKVTYSINDKVKIFANVLHDFKSDQNLRLRFGVNFGDECTDARIFYEEINYTDGIIKPSQNIKFQIAFKNLGIIEDDPF